MRLASRSWGGRDHVGSVSACGREVTPLAVADAAMGLMPLIEALPRGEALPHAQGVRMPVEVLQLRAPLPRPRRNLLCVGRNCHAHAAELASSVFRDYIAKDEGWLIVFTKMPECVVGPHDEVRLPGAAVSTQIDCESELAVIIGRGGRNIGRAQEMQHVFGCTVLNDLSASDVQMRHQQWDLGKSFDSFCPMGPWIVTADELDGRDTRVRGWVNGELSQDGRTRDLIFDTPTLIETCSRGITLFAGAIIATGTPAGAGMGFDPPRYLQAGDVVRIEIDGIGVNDNCFVY